MAGSLPSSRATTSTSSPFTPPASLISRTARSIAVISGVPYAAAVPDVGSHAPMRSRPSTLRRGAVDESVATVEETVASEVPSPPEQPVSRLAAMKIVAIGVVIDSRRSTLPIGGEV